MKGVNLKIIKKIKNNKGDIFKILSRSNKEFSSFGECYISEVKPNQIKAWRYHKINSQKMIVIDGKCLFVLFDQRKNSLTNGQIIKFKISSKNNLSMLIIPKKIWYGFKCLGIKKAKILNITNKIYNNSEILRKEINDNEVPFKWNNK